MTCAVPACFAAAASRVAWGGARPRSRDAHRFRSLPIATGARSRARAPALHPPHSKRAGASSILAVPERRGYAAHAFCSQRRAVAERTFFPLMRPSRHCSSHLRARSTRMLTTLEAEAQAVEKRAMATAALSLTNSELLRLEKGQQMNDAIIHYGIARICENQNAIKHKVAILTPYASNILLRPDNDFRRLDTVRAMVRVASTVLVPVHWSAGEGGGEDHWTLVYVERNPGKRLQVVHFDPLAGDAGGDEEEAGGVGTRRVQPRRACVVSARGRNAAREDAEEDASTRLQKIGAFVVSLDLGDVQAESVQSNAFPFSQIGAVDCGLYVLLFIELIVKLICSADAGAVESLTSGVWAPEAIYGAKDMPLRQRRDCATSSVNHLRALMKADVRRILLGACGEKNQTRT